MVKSIIIVCDQSPIGKNSAAESIRLGAGLVALGDIDCKIILRGDAVYFLSKSLNPEAVNMDPFSSIFKLIKLADLEIFVLEDSLKKAGLERSDLIDHKYLRVIGTKKLAKFIQNSDASFKF